MQALEKRRHALHVEVCALQGLKADPVGLAFEFPRVIELRRDHPGLGAECSGLGEVAARAGGQQRQREPRQRQGGNLPLPADLPRNMPLRDVGNLVREHTCQLGFGLGGEDQPGMHTDKTPGHGKGVERGITHDEEFKILARVATRGNQPVAQGIDVVGQLRVVVVAEVAPNLVHDVFAQTTLLEQRERRLGHIAKIRQFLPHATGKPQREGQQQQPKINSTHANMIPLAVDKFPKTLEHQNVNQSDGKQE